MSSDSEIDDLQRFEESKQRELAKKAGLTRNQFQEEEMSDEDVMELDYTNSEEDEGQDAYYDQDDKTIESKRQKTSREIEDNWGQTRDNYFGGEDDVGVSDDASEEEEQEALRLRERELEEMDAADFIDEDDMETWKTGAAAEEEEETVVDKIANIDVSSMSAEERQELVQEKFPAVILLKKQLSQCDVWASELEDKDIDEELKEKGRTALSTYRGMIYAYFALFTDRIIKGDWQALTRLEEHPVNEALLISRQLWLDFNEAKPKKARKTSTTKASSTSLAAAIEGTEDLDAASASDSDDYEDARSRFMDSGDDESESATSDSDDEFAIAKPTKIAKTKKVHVKDFDETADTIEEQARAKNKQSLRFYTSQIGKNDKHNRPQITGDEDLPYKEREFERRQRLMAEAQRRGQQEKDVLGMDDEDNFVLDDDLVDDGADEGFAQYAQAAAEKAAKKEEKQQRHEEALEAARKGKLDQYLAENPNIDKRAINYQIEKNKGLTRKRKKENRNARVKKRVRYEQAKKKLQGVRREYKEPSGPYQGELTGIRKNLTHSTRFKN